MKNLKIFMLLPVVLAVSNAFAQSGPHLNLSDRYPAAGEKLTFTYDPSGTVVDGKKDITAIVYYLDNKDYPTKDVALMPDGKLLKGELTVPDSAKAFFVRISSGADVDNNDSRGYVYLIYKDKQPVEGAYAMDGEMFLRTYQNYLAKIKIDANEGSSLFSKEFKLYPNGNKDYVYTYYTLVARLPDYKESVGKKVAELEKSSNEEDLDLAETLLRELKNISGADSLSAIIRVKYPNGILVKNKLIDAFNKEKDPSKKDSLYQIYVEKYPEDKNEKGTSYENLRLQLVAAYLNKGDMVNFHRYDSQLKNKANLQGELNNVAYEWAKKGEHLDDAEVLSKESLDIVKDKLNNPQPEPFASPAQMKKNYEYTYDMNADTYAFVLYKESKFAEALKYEQQVIDHSKTIDPDVYGNYIQILLANGQDARAKETAENVVKAGQGTAGIKEVLKNAYVKAKGSDAGYDKYISSLENNAKIKAREELAKTMINQPAPVFALKDIDGNTVSLKDLKGKVVIVDFWSTWCGPCKASFPGMQLAVNKYKDDPNVKFLFVDCWETADNYLDGVKKFITDNKYTFHVLMDEKGDDGRQSKVVSTFGVTGIPTKFIIDKNGNIRFKYIGYSGTPEKLLDEVTNMVDMTENPDGVVSSQVNLNK